MRNSILWYLSATLLEEYASLEVWWCGGIRFWTTLTLRNKIPKPAIDVCDVPETGTSAHVQHKAQNNSVCSSDIKTITYQKSVFLLMGWDSAHLVVRSLFGLLYQPPMIDDDDDCAATGGMRIGRGNRSTPRKPALVSLCPSQIPHDLIGLEPGTQRWEVGD
jgi:hypothetical protein